MHGVTPEFANTMMYLTIPLLIGAFGYLGLLLLTERIAPNAVFGFRTKRTLADSRFWYAANKAAGRYIFCAASVSAALFAIMALSASASWSAAMLVLLGPLALAVALSLVWHERH